jgi:hypothetical protein
MFRSRPPTTTINPDRDLDWVLTWGVQISTLSTLPVNFPAISNHLGFCIDIDISNLFGSTYGCFSQPLQRKLTSKNVGAREKYMPYINTCWKTGKYLERSKSLQEKIQHHGIQEEYAKELQLLDAEITEALFQGEFQCAKLRSSRDPWSPALAACGKCLTYWKCKYSMARSKHFRWSLLDYSATLGISLEDHTNQKIDFIKNNLRSARQAWKEMRVKVVYMREQFLSEMAEDYAKQYHITEEKSLKAIKQSEHIRWDYQQIRRIVGHKKDKKPLTKITSMDMATQDLILLTTRDEIKDALLRQLPLTYTMGKAAD